MSRRLGAEALRRRLEQYLQELGVAYSVDRAGDFAVSGGHATTFVSARDRGERTVARIWAITNVDVEPTDELTRYLLTENAKIAFGGFQTDGSSKVALSHTLLGDYLQRAELEVALAFVASTADRYAEEIKRRFGGKLFGET